MAVILETNFVRLLTCTEDLVSAGKTGHWHYPVFLEKLESLLKQINSSSPRPTAEFLHIYENRLKQLTALRESSMDSSQNPFIIPLLQYGSTITSPSGRKPTSACSFFNPTLPPSTTPYPLTSLPDSSPPLKPIPVHRFFSDVPDLLQRQRNKQNQELRRQLLESSLEDKEDAPPRDNTDPNYDEVLNSHSLDREKIAEYMLSLTKDLRLTSLAIGERIRSDMAVLEESNTIAQVHAASLSDISRSLREELGRSFGLVVWILFLVSIVVFFWMIIFMKFA